MPASAISTTVCAATAVTMRLPDPIASEHADTIVLLNPVRSSGVDRHNTADALYSAAQTLFGALERGQRLDAATLRTAMETAFSTSDAAGAWDWKLAYEATEAATVLFLRRYGPVLIRKVSMAAQIPASGAA